jgi:hypothetical protein
MHPDAPSLLDHRRRDRRRAQRVNNDLNAFDIASVIRLDEVALRAARPTDVQLRILAASAEHNVDHAALADTMNIAEARGGKIYPATARSAR